MTNTSENDICINFGFINDCKKCDNMCNFKCENYESKNTRQVELSKLYKLMNNSKGRRHLRLEKMIDRLKLEIL